MWPPSKELLVWHPLRQQCITERIWLWCFAPSPKFPFRKLQIRSGRYMKSLQGAKSKYNLTMGDKYDQRRYKQK